jgi:amino acid permease
MASEADDLHVGRSPDGRDVEMDNLNAVQPSDPDLADANGQDGAELESKRARKFAPRHIQMMALGMLFLPLCIEREGSSIATVFFFQSGKVLYFSGWLSMLLAFLLMGSLTYAVLVLFWS